MSSFTAALRPLAPLLVATTIIGFGSGLISVLIGVRVASSPLGGASAGLLLSSYFAGLVVGARTAPFAIGWAGPVRCFAGCAAVLAVVALLFTRVDHWSAWVALRALSGLLLAWTFAVTESWINIALPAQVRARGFTAYLTLNNGATGLAPLALSAADPLGPSLFVAGAAAFALSPVALLAAGQTDGGRRRVRAMPLRQLLPISPAGIAACFAHGLINAALVQVAPVYFARVGLGYALLSLFIGLGTAARILCQPPVGAASDRWGRAPVMLGLAVGTALLSLPLAAAGPAPGTALVFIAGLAAMTACGPLYALGVAAVNDRLEPRQVLPASGGSLLAWAAGSMIGPVLATTLMDQVGPGGLYMHTAAAGAALAALVLLQRR